MNTTTKPGVLAVMDTVAEHTFPGRAVALREARATVERLAEAAQAAEKALHGHDDPVLRSLARELAVAHAAFRGGA